MSNEEKRAKAVAAAYLQGQRDMRARAATAAAATTGEQNSDAGTTAWEAVMDLPLDCLVEDPRT